MKVDYTEWGRPGSFPVEDWARTSLVTTERQAKPLCSNLRVVLVLLSEPMRALNGICFFLVFRFLKGPKEIWKKELPGLASIDLFWFWSADFYIKNTEQSNSAGLAWADYIRMCSILWIGQGLIVIWAASLRPRKVHPYQWRERKLKGNT